VVSIDRPNEPKVGEHRRLIQVALDLVQTLLANPSDLLLFERGLPDHGSKIVQRSVRHVAEEVHREARYIVADAGSEGGAQPVQPGSHLQRRAPRSTLAEQPAGQLGHTPQLGLLRRGARLQDEAQRDLRQLRVLGDQEPQAVVQAEAMEERQLEGAELLGQRGTGAIQRAGRAHSASAPSVAGTT
jgi:hypothetical protein